jgi:hypothetical protein
MRGSAWQARQGLAPGVGLPGRGGPLSRSGSPGALPALEARGLQAYAAQRRKGRAENRRLDWRDRWDFTLKSTASLRGAVAICSADGGLGIPVPVKRLGAAADLGENDEVQTALHSVGRGDSDGVV